MHAHPLHPPRPMTQVGGTVPDGRINHTMCTLDNFLYVYGGSFKTAAFGDVHRLDTGGATIIRLPTGSVPRPAE